MGLSTRIVLLTKRIAGQFNDVMLFLSQKVDKTSLSEVATSGSYGDLLDKPVIPSAVTESTVAGWGFTKNTGTYSKPSTGITKNDMASDVRTSLGKADTALQAFTETDPTVPAWAKQPNKPTYTASEVGALPDTTVIPTVPVNVSAFTNDAGYLTEDFVLQNVAGVDLSNVSNSGRSVMSGMPMPSNLFKNLTLPANGGSVTAPSDGWLLLVRQSTGSGQLVRLMGKLQAEQTSSSSGQNLRVVLPVSRGDVVTVGYSATSNANLFRFYYANGSSWEV